LKLASTVVVGDAHIDFTTKQFTAEEFRKLMRSANFVGACLFWQELAMLAAPDRQTSLHARGVLKEIAKGRYADCGGYAYSLIQARRRSQRRPARRCMCWTVSLSRPT
jgi:hypothetical protein